MIYSQFRGRTGNQMFQFAVGRALSLKLGVPLAVDDRASIAKGHSTLHRVFQLPVSTPKQLPPARHEAPVRYAIWRGLKVAPKLFREPSLGFCPEVMDLPDETYLHGYWQSEKYFLPYRDQILADFTFPEATGKNAEMAARITETNSVSLHVRRGDYVSDSAYVACDQAYYDAALATLLPRLQSDPAIFVFSDEPDWARNNLKLPGEVVVIDHNGPDADYEDLRLMSLCKHNITANSSFSWWSAWLNTNKEKQVVAPKEWFGKSSMQNPDIWAEGWSKV